mgnify:CR=1 FL=1
MVLKKLWKILKAKEKNVVIGAHIGFNDIQGFGYRPVELKEDVNTVELPKKVGADEIAKEEKAKKVLRNVIVGLVVIAIGFIAISQLL